MAKFVFGFATALSSEAETDLGNLVCDQAAENLGDVSRSDLTCLVTNRPQTMNYNVEISAEASAADLLLETTTKILTAIITAIAKKVQEKAAEVGIPVPTAVESFAVTIEPSVTPTSSTSTSPSVAAEGATFARATPLLH